jgi:uncharacterized protein DUF6455
MSCPTMLRRVAEDAGPLLSLIARMAIDASVLARAHPGELARAVHNCLECLDRAACEELSSQGGRLLHPPDFCANRGWVSERAD